MPLLSTPERWCEVVHVLCGSLLIGLIGSSLWLILWHVIDCELTQRLNSIDENLSQDQEDQC